MGTNESSYLFNDARPVHEVTIPTFQMSKTLVTVEQYAECVIKGGCTKPDTGNGCNWGQAGRQRHPINCVDWNQANQYAKFKGARLPSESEYEYAAKSGGKNQKYPWGNDDTSDKAVIFGNTWPLNGLSGVIMPGPATMPVCSKPAGNTSQGLCDMVGNGWEWVEDTYQSSYVGAPTDGSAVETAGSDRVVRGGNHTDNVTGFLRVDFRDSGAPGIRLPYYGFRIASSSR
jgi:formylglycine-generating enzyme required for sulfatase activity